MTGVISTCRPISCPKLINQEIELKQENGGCNELLVTFHCTVRKKFNFRERFETHSFQYVFRATKYLNKVEVQTIGINIV
jgi:hypothetical protein